MSLPVSLLDFVEISSGDEIRNSVIWLHGLGADGNDLAPVVRELALPNTRFILPHAPVIPVTINKGYAMRAWYDIYSFEPGSRQDANGIHTTQKQIEALIAHEKERGIASQHIMLAGFSQGGAIALHTALRHQETLAGVLALSTYLPLANSLASEQHAANQATPIFIAHGTQDTVIPLDRYHASADALQRHGYKLERHEYPMPHSVCLEEIDDIRHFMQQHLDISLT